MEQKVLFGVGVFLALFKDEGCKVSPKCHLHVFEVNQGKEAD